MSYGKLSNVKCQKTAFNPGGAGNKLSDGGGLFLHIKENGKYWRLSYRFLGKQKTLSLGVYPQVTLAEARVKRDAARKMIEAGKDPNIEKKIAKLELHDHYANNFEALAREWHGQKKHTWKEKHAATILKRFEVHIFPKIGERPINDLKVSELLAALRPLEKAGKRDLAHRMLQHSGQIFRYAVATGRAETDITPNLKGALQSAVSKGHAHLTEAQLPEFLAHLNQYDTKYNGNVLTKLAFKLLILTFVRSGEIRGAKWDEIDWEKKQWRIPAERMKMREPHIVPLSTQSINILKQIQEITGHNYSNYVLPSQYNPRSIMSENTFLRAIKIMGYKGKTTGHGFRSTASTILNENGFSADHIERQLAHAERDQVRAAYNYAEYIPERHKMMQWWGDYLEKAGL